MFRSSGAYESKEGNGAIKVSSLWDLRILLSILFHACKWLIEKGITGRRWGVQFAGSVAETKIET
jgi:hypothetical protein